MKLIAPRYAPAVAFHPPTPAIFDFGVDSLSIEELRDNPTWWPIVLKHAPWAGMMVRSPAFQNYMSIFTLRDIASFLPKGLAASIDAIDVALRQLPRSEWPANAR